MFDNDPAAAPGTQMVNDRLRYNRPRGNRFTIVVFICLFLLTCVFGFAEDQSILFEANVPSEQWSVVTRYDYALRINGKYLGYTNREIRELYRVAETLPDGWRIDGTARVLESTKKNGIPVAARLESTWDAGYFLGRDGELVSRQPGFPSPKGFPSFPDKPILSGSTWEAPLEIRIVGPEGEHNYLPLIASYRFLKTEEYQERPAHFIEVIWAMRYAGDNPDIDNFLVRVEGSHQVLLVVDSENFQPIFARDKITETWEWTNGSREKHSGFSLKFWNGVQPMNKVAVREGLENQLRGWANEIHETDNGLSLTLRMLHFQPDQAILVPDDVPLLEILAKLIKGIEGRTILVRGHTASVGQPENEQQLSEGRAQYISDALTARGVNPRRLIYEGVGGREPIASNDSDEGRRLNRRVELLIIGD